MVSKKNDMSMAKIDLSPTTSSDSSINKTSSSNSLVSKRNNKAAKKINKGSNKTNKQKQKQMNKSNNKNKLQLQFFKLQPKYAAAISSSQKQLSLNWIGVFILVLLASSVVYTLSNDTKLLSGPFMLDAGSKILENPDIRTVGKSLMENKVGSETTHSNLNYNDPSRPLASLSFQLNYKYGGFDPIENELHANVFRITNFVLHAFNAVLVGYLAHLLQRALRFNSDCATAIAMQTSASKSTSVSALQALPVVYNGESLVVACAATALFAASPLNHAVAMYTYARSDIMGATATFLYVILGLRRLLSSSSSSKAFLKSRSSSGEYLKLYDYEEERTKFCFDTKMFFILMFGLFSKQLVVVVPVAFLFLHLVVLELPWQWRQQQLQQMQLDLKSANSTNDNATGSTSGSTTTSANGSGSDDPDTSISTKSSSNPIIDCMANVLYSLARTIYCHLLSFIAVGCYFIFRLVKFGRVTDLEMISPNSLNYRCYVTNQPYAWFRYALTMFYPKGIALDHNLIQDVYCQKDEMKAACIALFVLFVLLVVRTFSIAKVKKSKSPSFTTGTDPIEVILLAGLGFYGLNILPSSIVVTTDVYCERRAYAAGAGIYCAFVICLFEVLKRFARTTSSSSSEKESTTNKSGSEKSSSYKTSIVYTSIVTSILSYFMLTSLEINPTFYSDEALWREVVRQYPGSIRGMTNLGNALAKRVQDQLTSCNPDTHAIFDPSTCPAFDSALYQEAEGFYLTLLESRPSDGYAINGMARLKHLVGKTDEAIAYWRKTAAVDPLLAAGAYKMIGTQLHKMRRLDEAIVEYNRAMKIAPDLSGELYNNLALAYLNIGNHNMGKRIFKEGMERFPGEKLLLSNKHLFSGNGGGYPQGYQQQGGAGRVQQTGGFQKFDKVPPGATIVTGEADDPNFPIYLFYQGLHHHQAGEVDKAETFYRKHLEVTKQPMPDVYNNLSIILSQAGKLLEGREMWMKGIERDPKNEQLLNNKAYIFRGE